MGTAATGARSSQAPTVRDLVRHTHEHGRSHLFLSAIGLQVNMTPREVDVWLSLFERHGLLRPIESEKSGAVAYQMVHGTMMDPQQLTLDVHGILAAIDNLSEKPGQPRGLSNRQQLALEKLVLRHFDWATSEISATTDQLDNLIPRWEERTRERVIESLVEKGILHRTKFGYSGHPHRFTLHLPESVRSDGFQRPPSL